MLLYQEKIFKPAGQSLPDTEIARELAIKMGYGDEFNMTSTELFDAAHDEAYYKAWFEGRTGRLPTEEETLTPAKIREKKVMRILPSMEVNGKKETIYPMCRDDSGAEPDLKIDTLNTGRLEIFCENPGAASISGFGGNIDSNAGNVATYERFPVFEPPYETWDAAWSGTSALYPNTSGMDANHTRNAVVSNSYLDAYPLHNFSQRIRWRVHTQWYYTPWIRELEPQPVVYIHPDDAQTAINGPVNTGDVVEIYNDRGAYRSMAIINPGLRPGVIDAPRGWQRWQYDRFYGREAGYALNAGAKDAGSCNDVTSRRVHIFSGCQAFFDARVNIRKIIKSL
jgi:molybdopterin-containing oxidoreductase family molybdopterin binding subunit